MIIVLIISAYLVIGVLFGMGYAFIGKRTGNWIDDDSAIFCGICILFWPVALIIISIVGIGTGVIAFFDWFAICINEKDAE